MEDFFSDHWFFFFFSPSLYFFRFQLIYLFSTEIHVLCIDVFNFNWIIAPFFIVAGVVFQLCSTTLIEQHLGRVILLKRGISSVKAQPSLAFNSMSA